jgi:hypothetical protein
MSTQYEIYSFVELLEYYFVCWQVATSIGFHAAHSCMHCPPISSSSSLLHAICVASNFAHTTYDGKVHLT